MFRCTIVCQPEQDWNLSEGDEVLVERYFFERAWHLVCRTIQDTMGFDWQ